MARRKNGGGDLVPVSLKKQVRVVEIKPGKMLTPEVIYWALDLVKRREAEGKTVIFRLKELHVSTIPNTSQPSHPQLAGPPAELVVQKKGIPWASILSVFLALLVGGIAANYLSNVSNKPTKDMVAPIPENALVIKSELRLKPGMPESILAETPGVRVEWIVLDETLRSEPPKESEGLRLLPKSKDQKEVWVWGSPGKYRVLAYTAVNGQATPYATCRVTVEDDTAPVPMKDQKKGS